MPTVNVVTNRPATPNGLVITTDRGATFRMGRTPSSWNFKDVWSWEETEREGSKALTKKKSPGRRTLNFSILIARPDPDQHVEDLVRPLTELGAYGLTFRVKGGSAVYQGPCWWYAKDIAMTVLRLNRQNMPTQVQLDFQLEEYTGSTSAFVKPPSPAAAARPPVRPASPTPAKAPVYRWHTVVAGEWLSTIAQRYLGDMKRWPEIQRLNPFIRNPNYLAVGDRLKIPPR